MCSVKFGNETDHFMSFAAIIAKKQIVTLFAPSDLFRTIQQFSTNNPRRF